MNESNRNVEKKVYTIEFSLKRKQRYFGLLFEKENPFLCLLSFFFFLFVLVLQLIKKCLYLIHYISIDRFKATI